MPAKVNNEKLVAAFARARSVSTAPFFGIPLGRFVKAAQVANGLLDGRSGEPVVRDRGSIFGA